MRSFLKSINVKNIEDSVSTNLEVAKYMNEADQPILFNDIQNYQGWRISGNLINSRNDLIKLLDTTKDQVLYRFISAMDNPKKIELVKDAPFLKNQIQKPSMIKEIPFTVFNRWMNKFYSSATIILAKDPDTGRQNASIHRLMPIGNTNKIVGRIVPRELREFYSRNKNRGQDTPIVIICGVHPAIVLAAASSYPDLDELELANNFLQGKLKCVEINGMKVPQETEVVMAGRILHDEVEDEGPFVDVTGTWDVIRKEPVIEIAKIYKRDNPIWHTIIPSNNEHKLLMGSTQEPRIFQIIKNTVPSVKSVVLTNGGSSWLHAIVSIKKRREGEAKNAALAALAAHPSLKRVIVVDDDIDINNSEEVEWALATRLRPAEGIDIINNTKGSSLDPSAYKKKISSKWMIDATIPLDSDRIDFLKAKILEDEGVR